MFQSLLLLPQMRPGACTFSGNAASNLPPGCRRLPAHPLGGITGSSALKGHIAIDPDAEVITATAVTAGNTGDAASAVALLAGDVPDPGSTDNTGQAGAQEGPLAVYGDAAYGAGALLADLEAW